MSPLAKCPRCKRKFEFHEDEMDSIADGSGACADCRLQLAENAFILGIAMGTVDPPKELLGNDEEDE